MALAQTLNRCNESASSVYQKRKNYPYGSGNFTTDGHGFRVGSRAPILRKKLFKIFCTLGSQKTFSRAHFALTFEKTETTML